MISSGLSSGLCAFRQIWDHSFHEGRRGGISTYILGQNLHPEHVTRWKKGGILHARTIIELASHLGFLDGPVDRPLYGISMFLQASPITIPIIQGSTVLCYMRKCNTYPRCLSRETDVSNMAVGLARFLAVMSRPAWRAPWNSIERFFCLVTFAMRLFNLAHHLNNYRLEDHKVPADILSGADSGPTHQARPYVADNVPIEIGHNHDIKLVRIGNQLTQSEKEERGRRR